MSFKSDYKKLLLYILLSSILGVIFSPPSNANIFEFGNFKIKSVTLNADKNELDKKNNVFETKQVKLDVSQVKSYERIKLPSKQIVSKAEIVKKPSLKIETKSNEIVKKTESVQYNKLKKQQSIVKRNFDSKSAQEIKKIAAKKIEVENISPLPIKKTVNTEEFKKTELIEEKETSLKEEIGAESLDQIKDAPWKKADKVQSIDAAVKKDVAPYLGSIVGGLALVLLIIFIIWGLYMKFTGKGPVSGIASGNKNRKKFNFNLLSSATLGQGKDIHLVEINGKQIVIGSTANSINVLTELNDEENEKLNQQLNSNSSKENEYDVQKNEDDTMYNDPDIYENSYAALYKEYLDKEKKNEPK